MGYTISTSFYIILCYLFNCGNPQNLSEIKRFELFPKGTTFSVQICLTFQTGITPGSIFTEAINWGVNYPLQIKEKEEVTNDTTVTDETLVRRERRSLFMRIEKLFYHMGYDGRHCILRALCEYSSQFQSEKKTVVNQLLRIIFKYTTEALIRYESREDKLYHEAQINGELKAAGSCFNLYPKCHFSLLNLLLGYHSPQNLMKFMRKKK